MTEIESHYEIQFSTIQQPDYWRAYGEPNNSFVEIAKKVRESIDNLIGTRYEDKLIHSFRIVEKRYFITTEEIKTFKV